MLSNMFKCTRLENSPLGRFQINLVVVTPAGMLPVLSGSRELCCNLILNFHLLNMFYTTAAFIAHRGKLFLPVWSQKWQQSVFFQTAEEKVNGWISLWNKIPKFRLCFLIRLFGLTFDNHPHTYSSRFLKLEEQFRSSWTLFNVLSVNKVSCWMSLEQTRPCRLPRRPWFLMGALIDTVRWCWNLW